jgi:tetratricopeptide (TPR) repeat protein/transcriptional regulator with XRE-family HTH domain
MLIGGVSVASLETFVQNVRNLMEQRGLKLTQVAEQVGVTKSYLSLILSNTRKNVSDDIKDRLAAVLGTTVADLYTPVDPGIIPAVRVPQLIFNNSPRQKLIEQIDSVTYLTQANENLAHALYRGTAALGDAETDVVTRFFESTLDYLNTSRGLDQWQVETGHFQAFGFGQIKQRLSFEARVVLSHLAVIRNSCGKDLLVKILPSAIAEQVDSCLEALWQANLINLQYSEETTFVTCTLEDVLSIALTWLTATAKRNINHRIARELAREESENYLMLNRIAHHFTEAGELLEARKFLVSAQEKAFAVKDYANATVFLQNLGKLAQGLADKNLKAFVAHQSGLTEFYLGNYEVALRNFKAALLHYRQNQELYSLAEIHNAMGATYLAIYDHSNAKKHLQRGLQNLTMDVKTVLRAKLLVNLGTLYSRLNDWQKAEDYYKLAVNFATEIGDVFVRAYATIGLGTVARNEKNWQGSIKILNDALHLLDEGSQLVAQVLTNLGISHRLAGDKTQSLAILQEALGKARLARDLRSEVRIYLELAALYLDAENINLAAEFARKAHELLEKSKNPKDFGELCYILGRIALASGDLARAREMLTQALGIINQVNAEEKLQNIFHSLAQLCQMEGDNKNAQFYTHSAEKIQNKLHRR